MGKFKRSLEKTVRLDRSGSYATRAARRQVIHQFGVWLEGAFKKAPLPQNISGKHVYPFLQELANNGVGNGRICNVMSHLRRMLYLVDAKWEPPTGNLEIIMKIRKTPEGPNKGVRDRIGPDRKTDLIKADLSRLTALEMSIINLARHCGLRAKEASLLQVTKPVCAGDKIAIFRGTKGGRPRTIIATSKMAEVLNAHRALTGGATVVSVATKTKSTTSNSGGWVGFKNHLYKALRNANLTREGAGTLHGLRHSWAAERFDFLIASLLTAQKCEEAQPSFKSSMTIRQWKDALEGQQLGQEQIRTAIDCWHQARQQLAAELGHGREEVTDVYVRSSN